MAQRARSGPSGPTTALEAYRAQNAFESTAALSGLHRMRLEQMLVDVGGRGKHLQTVLAQFGMAVLVVFGGYVRLHVIHKLDTFGECLMALGTL